ncbi:uncharacterized protein SPSK_04626 [Sporothrix schenckii 1099-18]|uniref:Uncharacterized protein n=1 Tax=Sporothrix schenckii 1099-18 TaxID=1397361 RepID=A0A0F2M3Z2_SPOSC|nr:uncharacterized protein SPSK_04626 [Sporothrix schenckii 1099-18]KJR82886.1 hypothetical protein SPSK_04626 [Sporothrix schenckii 1099-18]
MIITHGAETVDTTNLGRHDGRKSRIHVLLQILDGVQDCQYGDGHGRYWYSKHVIGQIVNVDDAEDGLRQPCCCSWNHRPGRRSRPVAEQSRPDAANFSDGAGQAGEAAGKENANAGCGTTNVDNELPRAELLIFCNESQVWPPDYGL